MSITELSHRIAQLLVESTPIIDVVPWYRQLQDVMDSAVMDRQRYHPAYYIDRELQMTTASRERLLQLIQQATDDWKLSHTDVQNIIDITANSITRAAQVTEERQQIRSFISDHVAELTSQAGIQLKACGSHRRGSTYTTHGSLKYKDDTSTARLGSYLSSVCSADVPMIALLPSRLRQNELNTEYIKTYAPVPPSSFTKYDVLTVGNTPKMICLVADSDTRTSARELATGSSYKDDHTNNMHALSADDYTVVTMTMKSDQLTSIEQVTISFEMTAQTQPEDILRKLCAAVPTLTIAAIEDHRNNESNITGLTRVLISHHVPLPVLCQMLSGIQWQDNLIHSLFTSHLKNNGVLSGRFLMSSQRQDFKFTMNSYRLTNGGAVVLADGTTVNCSAGQRYFTVNYINLADYETLELMLECLRYVVMYCWSRGIATAMFAGQAAMLTWSRGISTTDAEQYLLTMHDDNVDENSVEDGFVRSYIGPFDQVKSINAYNRTMHPDVFLAGKHSRSTQVNREPIVVDAIALQKWIAAYPAIEAMEFPWPGHPSRAGGKPPAFYVVCRPQNNMLMYPGIKDNRRSNKHLYPYVPVCRATKQSGPDGNPLYQRVYQGAVNISNQIHRNTKEVLPDKIAKPEGLGALPKPLRAIIESISGDTPYRLGVYAMPHSLLHTILAVGRRYSYAMQYMAQYHQHYPRVHELMITHYQQQSIYHDSADYRTEFINKLVKALAEILSVKPWMVRQEQYDVSPEVVSQLLLDSDSMTPELYHHLITAVFGVNLYVFDHRKPTELVIPRHQLYHARMPANHLHTLVLMCHTGSEADDLQYPHYEAIITKNSTTGFAHDSKMWHELLCHHHEYIAWKPGKGGISNGGNTLDLNALTAPHTDIKQHFDGYGKLRAVTLDNRVTVFVPPTSPLVHRWATEGTDADIRYIPMSEVTTGKFKLFSESHTVSDDGEKVFWSVRGLDNIMYAYTTRSADDDAIQSTGFTNIDALQSKLSIMVQLLTWMQRVVHSVAKRFLTPGEFASLCLPPEQLAEDDYDVSKVPMVLPPLPPQTLPLEHTMSFIEKHTKNWVVGGKFRSYCPEWRDVLDYLNDIIVRSDSTYIPPFIIKSPDVGMRQLTDSQVLSFTKVEDYLTWLGENTAGMVNASQARVAIERDDTILTVTSQPYIMEYSREPVGQIMIQNVHHGLLINAMYVSSVWMSTGANPGYTAQATKAWKDTISQQLVDGTLIDRLTVYALDDRNIVRLIHNRDCPRDQRIVLLCYNQKAVDAIKQCLGSRQPAALEAVDYAAVLILTP